jgi:hypothetical protein
MAPRPSSTPPDRPVGNSYDGAFLVIFSSCGTAGVVGVDATRRG